MARDCVYHPADPAGDFPPGAYGFAPGVVVPQPYQRYAGGLVYTVGVGVMGTAGPAVGIARAAGIGRDTGSPSSGPSNTGGPSADAGKTVSFTSPQARSIADGGPASGTGNSPNDKGTAAGSGSATDRPDENSRPTRSVRVSAWGHARTGATPAGTASSGAPPRVTGGAAATGRASRRRAAGAWPTAGRSSPTAATASPVPRSRHQRRLRGRRACWVGVSTVPVLRRVRARVRASPFARPVVSESAGSSPRAGPVRRQSASPG